MKVLSYDEVDGISQAFSSRYPHGQNCVSLSIASTIFSSYNKVSKFDEISQDDIEKNCTIWYNKNGNYLLIITRYEIIAIKNLLGDMSEYDAVVCTTCDR